MSISKSIRALRTLRSGTEKINWLLITARRLLLEGKDLFNQVPLFFAVLAWVLATLLLFMLVLLAKSRFINRRIGSRSVEHFNSYKDNRIQSKYCINWRFWPRGLDFILKNSESKILHLKALSNFDTPFLCNSKQGKYFLNVITLLCSLPQHHANCDAARYLG